MQMKIGPEHNVADSGLLLYLVFWCVSVARNGFYTGHVMARVVSVFMLFLLLNGVIDVFNGVLVGDVIRYLRDWAYLTIVFVKPPLQMREINKLLKILFWITVCISIVLILQYIVGETWIGYSTTYTSGSELYSRGAKPPSFAIVFFCISFLNVFDFKLKTRIITSIALFMPVVLSMKMSYFVTIFLILCSCYFFKNNGLKIVQSMILIGLCVILLFAVFPVFYLRLQSTLNQSELFYNSNNKEEGNFSYRIDHFSERLNYVLHDPVRCIRGLGYVQERNFHDTPFELGQTNINGQKAMLDTGDIAWSILILRLGLLGILIYLVMYVHILDYFWKFKLYNRIIYVYFFYLLISLVFMSFGNTIIASGDYFIIPLLISSLKYENSALYL